MKSLKVLSLVLLTLAAPVCFASEDTLSSPVGMLPTSVTGNRAGEETQTLTTETLFERLLHQESRNNQFDKNGNPLTSVKGATGVAQIMPDTAPEAAQLAGLEWSYWRYRNDATYNMALGRAFLNSQLERYDGNHILALAAYNAGPGRVDKWLKTIGDPRKGEISNEDFIRLIPFRETKEYVSNILHGTPSKFAYSPSKRIAVSKSGKRFEFKDTHPGFAFTVAVSSTFNSESKLVGGL
ncbi:transglycosylase SLT domain-containing protein [Citrobacter sp. Cf062]|uniref:transglycosylase SLT domain-containing protein n=1 Tax=Citrobacter sp. Cf062 TaxID=2985046 RepID=UPI0025757A99|nr:transglycosylase SLT domain-containing protein [Citrobacter sp. Cf062]MDM3260464.1 transglycosylase SLT domain-containing protein [Citrobacter sp. Cf062]